MNVNLKGNLGSIPLKTFEFRAYFVNISECFCMRYGIIDWKWIIKLTSLFVPIHQL